MTKALSLKELANLAAQTEDQTEVQTSNFDNSPPEAGVTIGRFIEYIEIGKHSQNDYAGKPKPPADYVRVTFELLHPKKNIVEYEHEGEKRIRGEYITLKLTKKLGDKAKFKKLFNAMTYGRADIKHMAQMLGEAFVITIIHNTVKGTGGQPDKVYANIDKDGAYMVGAPFVTDPLEGTKTEVPVREPIRPLRLFLFDNPTKETWDSLFIDGTRKVKKDGGEEVEVSKNWLQETIMSALNYEGSALQAMLGGLEGLPMQENGLGEEAADDGEAPFEGGEEVAGQTAESIVAAANAAKAKSDAEAAKAKAAKTTSKPAAKAGAKPAAKAGGSASDALAALGLS